VDAGRSQMGSESATESNGIRQLLDDPWTSLAAQSAGSAVRRKARHDPLAVEDHELQAIRVALAAQERFAELARVRRERGTELGLGIGIESGYATLGRIGIEGRTTTERSGR
jgi:class 3 adenylate cyclase